MRLCRLISCSLFLQLASGCTEARADNGGKGFLDTLRISLQQRPHYFLNLAGFNSFISGDAANFFGFRTGVDYGHRLRFGMGFFLMNPNDVTSTITVKEDTLESRVSAELQVRYFSVTAEYVFYNRRPWQFSVFPLDVGLGGAHYRYISQLGSKPRLQTPDVPLVFYQPSVTAQYYLFRWFGLGASIGYRMTLYASEQVKEDWSAIGFSAGIRVLMDELYHEVFPDGIKIGSRGLR
jgi:hypothetical protein